MKKLNVLLVAFLMILGYQGVFGQKLNYAWAKKYNSTGWEDPRGVYSDQNGNVFTIGTFAGTIDLDPGTTTQSFTSAGSGDVFIQKLDANGNFVWARTFGGNGQDTPTDIDIDNSGNIYLSGKFTKTIDLDPSSAIDTVTSKGHNDIFIVKLNAQGNYEWGKTFGSTSTDEGQAVEIDNAGNVILGGDFIYTVDFDPGAGVANETGSNLNVFLLKLSPQGNFIWVKSFGGLLHDVLRGMEIDANNNIFITGSFSYTVDFDPGPANESRTSNGQPSDIYVCKFDGSGNFNWVATFGGTAHDVGAAIGVDQYGNVYSTGTFRNTVDFDPGAGIDNHTSAGSNDFYIQKLDGNGNLEWVHTFGNNSDDYGRALKVDASNNVYVAGSFRNSIDFDPGTAVKNVSSKGGNADAYTLKLDSAGNYKWVTRLGNYFVDQTFGLSVTSDWSVYAVGNFKNKVDFDPGAGTAYMTTSGTFSDGFIQKLHQCFSATTSSITKTECDTFTSPSGKFTWTNSGTYKDTILNSIGCDSIITFNLTIKKSTTSSISVTVCNQYTSPSGKVKTFSTDFKDTIPNSIGCDSIITIILKVNKVYGVKILKKSDTLMAQTATSSYQWLKCPSKAPINGETKRYFIPKVSGDYAVEITKNGCKDTTDCVSVVVVGIDENNPLNELSVFPNPSTGRVTISTNRVSDKIELEVRDMSGQLILEDRINNQNRYTLDLEHPAGVYFITLRLGEQIRQIKLVKL